MNMQNPTNADWYFDFVSPFAYLQLEQFGRLPAQLQVSQWLESDELRRISTLPVGVQRNA